MYDFIVVGAGSAGATLAARLAEDRSIHVLLVEAGPDYALAEEVPSDLLDSRDLPGLSHDWGYTAAFSRNRTIPYRRGMVVGGTSAINAAAALWGSPEDFAEWAALGNPQWAWDKVVPYFARLEDDPDGQGALHGRGGPISSQRYARHEWTAFQDAFFEASLAAGFAAVADHNAAATNGVGPWPMNRRGPMRISAALAYLGPARQRPNLTILPRTLVSRIAFDGRRATGVELLTDGVPACVKTGHVVLSAGAIGSPAILLRSGVGPAAALRRLGIATLVDQVGVGERLGDHPSITLRLLPRADQFDTARDPRFQVIADYSATGSPEANDMLLVSLGRVDLSGLPALHRQAEQSVVVGIAVALMQPHAAGQPI